MSSFVKLLALLLLSAESEALSASSPPSSIKEHVQAYTEAITDAQKSVVDTVKKDIKHAAKDINEAKKFGDDAQDEFMGMGTPRDATSATWSALKDTAEKKFPQMSKKVQSTLQAVSKATKDAKDGLDDLKQTLKASADSSQKKIAEDFQALRHEYQGRPSIEIAVGEETSKKNVKQVDQGLEDLKQSKAMVTAMKKNLLAEVQGLEQEIDAGIASGEAGKASINKLQGTISEDLAKFENKIQAARVNASETRDKIDTGVKGAQVGEFQRKDGLVQLQQSAEALMGQGYMLGAEAEVEWARAAFKKPNYNKIRVAVVGDSLANGWGAGDGNAFSYNDYTLAEQLQKQLNKGSVDDKHEYQVVNLARHCTVSTPRFSGGNSPYSESDTFRELVTNVWDVVVISLTVSDSMDRNTAYEMAQCKFLNCGYAKGLRNLVMRTKALGNPNIILLSPTPILDKKRVKEAWNIDHDAYKYDETWIIKQTAKVLNTEYLDMGESLGGWDNPNPEMFGHDKSIHLSNKGYEALAEFVAPKILGLNLAAKPEKQYLLTGILNATLPKGCPNMCGKQKLKNFPTGLLKHQRMKQELECPSENA